MRGSDSRFRSPGGHRSDGDTRLGERGRLLPAIARQALEERLENLSFDLPGGSWLQQPRACFVTLTADGALRGCVGRLESQRPLLDEVRENAVAAAFHDTRFTPLEAKELAGLEIEVSVLSPLEELAAASDAEAQAALQPGIDGVVIEAPGHRGTFLPQVWEEIPDPREFLHQLKLKAGLDPDTWPGDARLWRYTVEHWKEF